MDYQNSQPLNIFEEKSSQLYESNPRQDLAPRV